MKVLLLDVDGVLQFHDYRLVEKFEHDFNWKTSHAAFLKDLFLDPGYPLTQTGEADFIQVADRILTRHVEDLSAEKYLDIWLNSECRQNQELINLLPNLPTAYLATNQDNYRGQVIEDLYASYFEGVFISCRMGVRKPSVLYFEMILAQLGVTPQECTFVDDNQPNVDAGQAAGINSILFQSNEQLFSEFESIGILPARC